MREWVAYQPELDMFWSDELGLTSDIDEATVHGADDESFGVVASSLMPGVQGWLDVSCVTALEVRAGDLVIYRDIWRRGRPVERVSHEAGDRVRVEFTDLDVEVFRAHDRLYVAAPAIQPAARMKSERAVASTMSM